MTAACHLEVLVEEPSMEAFLSELLDRLLLGKCTFKVHPFQGKSDLLDKLEARLRAYAAWLPVDHRVVVVVDRDDEDCHELKRRLEDIARRSGLSTRSTPRSGFWQVVNRIVVEELESWYFGDWQAVCTAYPRVQDRISRNKKHRDPDAIQGAWEAFERVMQRYGYFKAGLRKVELARSLGPLIERERSSSRSFNTFCDAILEAVA